MSNRFYGVSTLAATDHKQEVQCSGNPPASTRSRRRHNCQPAGPAKVHRRRKRHNRITIGSHPSRRTSTVTPILENMGIRRLSTENTESDRVQLKEEATSGLPIIFPWTTGKRKILMSKLKETTLSFRIAHSAPVNNIVPQLTNHGGC